MRSLTNKCVSVLKASFWKIMRMLKHGCPLIYHAVIPIPAYRFFGEDFNSLSCQNCSQPNEQLCNSLITWGMVSPTKIILTFTHPLTKHFICRLLDKAIELSWKCKHLICTKSPFKGRHCCSLPFTENTFGGQRYNSPPKLINLPMLAPSECIKAWKLGSA